MRPPRQDIAAPPFPPGLEWLGGREPKLDKLVTVGPLLVHFFDFAQLNSVRALDYVAEWRRRYRDHGLAVLSIHSPRLALTRDPEAVEAAAKRLGIDWPVAVDSELRAFRDYGCLGWPSLFLWGKGGALRWHHLGEGEYGPTEEAIREQLEDGSNGGWPDLVSPLRAGDEPGAKVMAPTPELFPGGSESEPLALPGDGSPVELTFEAAGAYAAAGGAGTLTIAIDADDDRKVEVAGPGLYELHAAEHHARHPMSLTASGEIELYSIQFAPGPAG